MDENAAVVAVTFAVVTIASLLSAATGKVGKAPAVPAAPGAATAAEGAAGSEGAVLPRPRQSNALGRYGSAGSAGVDARTGSSGLNCPTARIPLRNSPYTQQQAILQLQHILHSQQPRILLI